MGEYLNVAFGQLRVNSIHQIIVVLTFCFGMMAGSVHAQDATETTADAVSATEETSVDEETKESIRRWYIMLGGANAHPKLKSEDLIREYFDPIMNHLAPGHGDVLTVGDLRDLYLLWTPFVAIGYNFNDKWSAFWQMGYASGKVRTKETTPSILLLPLHTDFEIKRGAFYTGVGLDYFPWGMPKLDRHDSFKARLKASRPYIGARATYTYAMYEAKVKIGFKPFRDIISLKLEDAWGIPSYGPVIGLDIPLTENSALSMNASYNWFTSEQDDFNGPAYTVVWKHLFK